MVYNLPIGIIASCDYNRATGEYAIVTECRGGWDCPRTSCSLHPQSVKLRRYHKN